MQRDFHLEDERIRGFVMLRSVYPRNVALALVCLLLLVHERKARGEDHSEFLSIVRARHRVARESIRTFSADVTTETTFPKKEEFCRGHYWRSFSTVRLQEFYSNSSSIQDALLKDSEIRQVGRPRIPNDQRRYGAGRSSSADLLGLCDLWRDMLVEFVGPSGNRYDFDRFLGLTKRQPRANKDTIDGRDCIRVSMKYDAAEMGGESSFTFWHDINCNCLIRKEVATFGDKDSLYEHEILEFREAAPGVFVPLCSRFRQYDKGELRQERMTTLSNVHVNEAIARDVCVLPPVPAGTVLTDHIEGTIYPIDENWKRIGPATPLELTPVGPTTSSAGAASPNRSPAPANEYRGQLAEEPKSDAPWVLLAAVVILAALGAYWFHDRRRTPQRHPETPTKDNVGMLRKSTFLFFLLALLAGGAVVIGSYSRRDPRLSPRAVFVYPIPESIRLEWPGDGEIAVARLEIKNPGSGELLVDQFATNNASAQVEREVDGAYVHVDSLRVPPGGVAELLVRVRANEITGDRDRRLIEFFCRSNDPMRPWGRIWVFIPPAAGGLRPYPRAIVLGDVPVGEQVRRVVDLYDASSFGRQLGRVRSWPPGCFDVRLLPPAEGERGAALTERKLVARLEVTARTQSTRQLDGHIEVYFAGGKWPSSSIPIVGEVVSAVRCWPSIVALPRRVEGRKVSSGEILVEGRKEIPLNVRVVSAPAGLRVDIRRVAGREDRRMVFVEGKPVDGSSRSVSDLRIRLGVRSGENPEGTVDIPVIVGELSS
jgi:hypothetical protein